MTKTLPSLTAWILVSLTLAFLLGSAASSRESVALGNRVGGAGPADPAPERRPAIEQIDALVARDLARHDLEPNPAADDATFLRRVYLDVIGRIPDAAETRAFLRSRDSRKRAQLIDRLLDSPGYISHGFNYFADLLRIKSRLANRISGEPYIHWIKSSLAENKPYDVMVREMLTANGAAHERGNGSTGYLLRDRGMPLDNMANTMRVFLGTRLECAQCHNHPSEKWTQKQFFEMAAFTGGLRYSNEALGGRNNRELRQLAQKVRRERGEQVYRVYRRQVQGLQAGIGGSGTGLQMLPDDYQYDDGAAGGYVTARAIFGEPVSVDAQPPQRRAKPSKNKKRRRRVSGRVPQIDSRTTFAEWVTDHENPHFTQVIANRMWKRLMGRGVMEPVDDIKDASKADNPELLAYLTRLMTELNYDLKSFQRVILNTETYQRQAWGEDVPAGTAFHFQGPLLRRMSAEQMWDSLLTLVIPDLDASLTLTSPRAESVYESYAWAAGKSGQELLAALDATVSADGEMASPSDMARRQAQATRKRAQPLYRKYLKARRRNDRAAMDRALGQMRTLGIDPKRFIKERQYGRDLVRASEIRTPAPAGHFLRDFGQSDRQQIEASHTDASVPQVLNLLNGFIDERLLSKKQGQLMTAIRRSPSVADKIRVAYVTILNRSPEPRELRVWKRDVAAEGDTVYSDLVWTLINSQEFRFVH